MKKKIIQLNLKLYKIRYKIIRMRLKIIKPNGIPIKIIETKPRINNNISASSFKHFFLLNRSNKFVLIDKKESLLLSIAKSNQEIVENTQSKPQKTLEYKMTKQKESFSFDVPLELPEQWMMGVPSLEVYNTIYNISERTKEQ